jgi:hypothetical protein
MKSAIRLYSFQSFLVNHGRFSFPSLTVDEDRQVKAAADSGNNAASMFSSRCEKGTDS